METLYKIALFAGVVTPLAFAVYISLSIFKVLLDDAKRIDNKEDQSDE